METPLRPGPHPKSRRKIHHIAMFPVGVGVPKLLEPAIILFPSLGAIRCGSASVILYVGALKRMPLIRCREEFHTRVVRHQHRYRRL